MQGLVDVVSQVGLIFAALFAPVCYLGALGAFFYAAWGFWRQAQPDNPFRGRPWVPAVSLFFCGLLATFDKFLTRANVTAGSTVVVGLTDMVSYTPTAASGSLLGASPAEFVVNVVALFQQFFQAFGAMACLLAALASHAGVTGRSDRTRGSCGVQFGFGVALINVLTISQWLADRFKT